MDEPPITINNEFIPALIGCAQRAGMAEVRLILPRMKMLRGEMIDLASVLRKRFSPDMPDVPALYLDNLRIEMTAFIEAYEARLKALEFQNIDNVVVPGTKGE